MSRLTVWSSKMWLRQIAFVLTLLFASWCGSFATSQTPPELPRLEYYIARDLYDAGNIGEATEGFRVAMNRGQQVNQQRWIDSVPALVMLGECYYQQGAIWQALEQYDAALAVALTFPTWSDALRTAEVQAEVPSDLKGINWTKLARRTQLVRVPRTTLVTLDQASAKSALGGVTVLRVDGCEVLRCLAVALQRRIQLLGPLARHSPLSAPLVQLFGKAPQSGPAWLQSSYRALSGLALLAVGDDVQAKAMLTAGSTIDKQSDYFLTPQCLLALASLDVKQGNDASALGRLGDASLRAAQLEQADALSDTLTMIGQLACAGRRFDLLPTLQSAVSWSQNYSALAYLSGSAAVSELAAVANNLAVHEAAAKQMLTLLGGKDVVLPRIQAQLGYSMARAAAAQNRLALAEQQLETSMSMLRGNQSTGAATPRVFQTQLTLELLARGDLKAAAGEEVFETLLGEPTELEWKLWPLECLVSISTTHLPAYEKLLELVQQPDNGAEVTEKMDLLQRERFYEVLPLGGRLLAVRQALMLERKLWSPEMVAQLEPVLKAYPSAASLPRATRDLLASVSQEPIAVDGRSVSAEAKQKFADLTQLTAQAESLIMSLALCRSSIPRHFPAPVNLSDVQQLVGDRDVVLSFGRTSSTVAGIAISRRSQHSWTIAENTALDVKTALLLTQIGLSGAPNLDSTSASVPWRATAAELGKILLPTEARAIISEAQRIIIIPNGNLWYLPFELLPATAADPRTPLLARHAVCYLPTLAHIRQIGGSAPELSTTVGVYNNFFAADRETNQGLCSQVGASLSNCTRLDLQQKGTLTTPSWLRVRADQLWVASELPMAKTPWELRLIPIEPSQENALANWMQSPLRAPAHLFLPGLQSSAQRVEMKGGNELFVPACTFMAAGARSVWMSRWKVGGRSAQSALSRIIEELEVEAPSSAWQRTAIALWAEKFATVDEPILPGAKSLPPTIQGNHPLLWSGYLMLGDHQAP